MLKEISFDFVEVPLWDAVAFVSTLTDCTIVLDSEVVRDAPRSITLRVDRMRTGRALRWICRLAGVAYGCRDEAIFITTPERAKAMPPRYGAARRRDGRLREGQEPPDDQAAAAMAKKISFDFVETPLQDVVAFISSLADITIVLDPDALRDEPRSLTLRVVDMRLADALRWVVKLVGMSYAWHDGALFVSMPGVLRELTSQEEALRVLQRPPTRALSATMAKPISFDLAETPLPDALRTLGERTGLHIALDPKADEATLRPLTLRVTEGQFDGALGWACTLTDTTYLWRDVDLVVTKPDLVDTRFRREEALRRLSRPPTKELAERMAEPVSFDFVETPLLDVIAFLVKLSGMNVVLDPGRIQGEAPAVTLRVHDMPLSAALRWVCRLAGRVCSWQDEALFVATLERAEAVRRQAEEFRPLQQPPSEELAARMAQEVNFNVTKAAMEDLLATTAESTDVPIILDPQAAEGGEPSITLSLRSARLDSALRWVCRRAGLVYVWRDGKIVVTTPERARVAPEPKE
jgi:hypothetical protein